MKFEFKSNYTIKSAKDEDGNEIKLDKLDAVVPEIELYDSVITLDDNYGLIVKAVSYTNLFRRWLGKR